MIGVTGATSIVSVLLLFFGKPTLYNKAPFLNCSDAVPQAFQPYITDYLSSTPAARPNPLTPFFTKKS